MSGPNNYYTGEYHLAAMEENGGGSGDDSRSCPRGHWRPAEDEKLRRLVDEYGPQNWNSIAEKLQGRSGIYIYIYIYMVRL